MRRQLTCAILALLLLLPACLLGIGQARAQSVPSGIVYSVPIMITNSQSEPTPSSFTLMVTVDFTQYSSVVAIAPNLQNVEFFNPSGGVIPSWLESGNSTSTDAIFWLRIGSISGTGKIFMGFASPTTNLFSQGGPVGEAPELSPAYGLYDNGVSIFPFYDNFQGNALGSNWVNNSAKSGNPVSVNNGLVIGQTSSTNSLPAVYSKNTFTPPGVLEFYTTIHTTSSSSGLGVGLMNSSDPLNNNIAVGPFRGPAACLWTTSNGTPQCSSQLNYNAPYVYSIAVPSQTPSSTVTATVDYGRYGSTSNSLDVPTIPLSIGFLNGKESPGVLGPTYWVRVRAYPPNGVMPTVTFPSSSSSSTSSSTTLTSNQTQPFFSVSCNPPSVDLGSSTTCQAIARGSNGIVPTGVVSWLSPTPGGPSPAGFSPQQCTLSPLPQNVSGMCSVSFTPSLPMSTVKIMATYSGDSHYPQTPAGFMLNVVSSSGTTTTSTVTSITVTSITVTSGNTTSVITSTIISVITTSGTPSPGTTTSGTHTVTSQTSAPSIPSLPSFSIDPLVPIALMMAMVVVAVAAVASWVLKKGGTQPEPAPSQTAVPGSAARSGSN